MRERGYSMIELVAVIAILGVLTALVGVGVRSFLVATHRTRATTQVADALAFARAKAVARSERWRVVMARDGSGYARSLLLQSCSSSIDLTMNDCTEGWIDDPKGPSLLESNTGLSLPAADVSIVFDRLGQAFRFDSGTYVQADAVLTICTLRSFAGPCDGGPTRTITILKYSGVLV